MSRKKPTARVNKDRLLEAIRQAGGNLQEAARLLGITDRAIRARASRDSEVRQTIDLARRDLVRQAEQMLHAKVREGDMTAVIFTLKTLGRHLGYTESAQTAHNPAGLDPEELREKILEFIHGWLHDRNSRRSSASRSSLRKRSEVTSS